tara:strand:- start:1317 stop:1562 length:246 start_codon:yes stop_codon:yes gene_type:complete
VDGIVRGCVISLFGLTYRAGPVLDSLLMGAASAYVGLQIPVAAGALICLITITVMSPKRKQLAVEMEQDSTAATIAEAKSA